MISNPEHYFPVSISGSLPVLSSLSEISELPKRQTFRLPSAAKGARGTHIKGLPKEGRGTAKMEI